MTVPLFCDISAYVAFSMRLKKCKLFSENFVFHSLKVVFFTRKTSVYDHFSTRAAFGCQLYIRVKHFALLPIYFTSSNTPFVKKIVLLSEKLS